MEDARNYIHAIFPEIQIGVTTTFEGATSVAASQISLLNTNMDVVMLTYYPISNSFIPRDPSTVANDVTKMLSASGGKKLVMQEWGYPSSSTLRSSESKQAQFFTNSFNELKKQGVEKFPFVSFFKYRDWNAAHCQALTGQTSGQNFYEFMVSLGLKRNDGADKEAFLVVANEIK